MTNKYIKTLSYSYRENIYFIQYYINKKIDKYLNYIHSYCIILQYYNRNEYSRISINTIR